MARLGEIESILSLPNKNESDCDPLVDLFSSALKTNSTSRLSQYKCREREETNQETRRRLLLEQQKKRFNCFRKRDSQFNERRSLEVNKDDNSGSGEWLKEEMFIENDEHDEMEWSSVKKVEWHKHGKLYQNVIMYSEWLMDIPADFTDKWIMVPCPVGKRSLVVSKQMRSFAFSKKGITVSVFKSLLPPKTILDCIWCFETKSFYILDVIQWNGMSFRNCQTDFRFYWLDSKFEENPEFSVRNENNNYPMIKLPRCKCSSSELSTSMRDYPMFQNDTPKLDGLLFYHSETHYTSGFTPLVGWMKAFMLPDAFGIPVPNEYMLQKPEGYQSYKQFIHDKDEKRKLYWANKGFPVKTMMECEEMTRT